MCVNRKQWSLYSQLRRGKLCLAYRVMWRSMVPPPVRDMFLIETQRIVVSSIAVRATAASRSFGDARNK